MCLSRRPKELCVSLQSKQKSKKNTVTMKKKKKIIDKEHHTLDTGRQEDLSMISV